MKRGLYKSLLWIALVALAHPILACSCAYVETFCESQTFGTDTIGTPLIVYGEKIRSENRGMRFDVFQVLHGELNSQSIFIRDGNGADCGMHTDAFATGKQFILALWPSWQEEEGPEKEYWVSICGLNFLEVEAGIVKGKISPGVNSIPLAAFNTLDNCGNLPPIVGGGLEVRLGPNPTDATLQVKVSLSGSFSGSARLFNALGQEIKRYAMEGENLWEKAVDVSRYAPGVYFMEVQVAARRKVFKFIVQR